MNRTHRNHGTHRTRTRTLGLALVSVATLASAAFAGQAGAEQPDGARGGGERRPGAHAPQPKPEPKPRASEFAPGELLVRFDPARVGIAPNADADRAVATIGGKVADTYDAATPGLRRVVLDPGVKVEDAVAALKGRDDVVYAEPNYLIHAAGIPNDSRFGELWGLHNTGQRIQGVAGAADADIDAPEAWNVTTGSANVTVAVIDTGIAYDYPDLAPNIWVNTREVPGNGIDDDRNGFVDDVRGWDFVAGDNDPTDAQGHGTHVAGTIGARGGNDVAGAGTTDIAGVAWNVKLMPLRVLDEAGNGTYANLAAAVDYARRNGAQVGNMSLSGWDYSHAVHDAMAAASGVTWIVAAGNDGFEVNIGWEIFPCDYDLANIICVAASDQRDNLASFSNFGATTVDIAAPGVNTLSAGAYSRVFFDDFEAGGRGWVFGGTPNTWARTTSVPLGADGTWLTDSPNGNYPNNANTWARTPALDLTGRRGCAAKFYGLIDTESWYDFFYVEAAKSTSGPWTQLGRASGFLDQEFDARLPATFDGAKTAYVRVRLNPDDMYDGDGLYLDNFRVECTGSYTGSSYQYLSGTSMATPHVTGVAALVLARNPAFTPAQLRARLLASVDRKASLAGKVASGGRINAYKAVTGT